MAGLTPPDCSDERSTVAPWTPRQRGFITEKIPLPTRNKRSQPTSRIGRTTQELSRDFYADPMNGFIILVQLFN